MTSKQEQLDNISRLKSELKQAQEKFDQDYGLSESEIKIIELLKRTKNGATASTLARHIRAFGRVEKESREQLLEKMILNNAISSKLIPTLSGRGRPCTKYFLVASYD